MPLEDGETRLSTCNWHHYPRSPCAPSFIKSRNLPILASHTTNTFLTFLKFLVCIHVHAGNPRVPPQGPKPSVRGQKSYHSTPASLMDLCVVLVPLSFSFIAGRRVGRSRNGHRSTRFTQVRYLPTREDQVSHKASTEAESSIVMCPLTAQTESKASSNIFYPANERDYKFVIEILNHLESVSKVLQRPSLLTFKRPHWTHQRIQPIDSNCWPWLFRRWLHYLTVKHYKRVRPLLLIWRTT